MVRHLVMVLILRRSRGGVLKCDANGIRGIGVAEDEWVERWRVCERVNSCLVFE